MRTDRPTDLNFGGICARTHEILGVREGGGDLKLCGAMIVEETLVSARDAFGAMFKRHLLGVAEYLATLCNF